MTRLVCAVLAALLAGGSPWRDVHDWLTGQHAALVEDLDAARAALVERAREAAPELVPELESAPDARRRRSGWGVLPPWRADPDPGTGARAPRERRYSLERITTAYTTDVRDGALLAARAGGLDAAGLRSAVPELDRLRRRADNLSEHLSYHAFWQAAVADEPETFADENALLPRVRRWVALERSGEDPAAARALELALRPELAPFTPSPAVRLRATEAGPRLVVRLATDVADPAFLERARRALADTYDASPAFRERGLALAIEWTELGPGELYPGGDAPEVGDAIDVAAHVARFPDGVAVLTTGAASTHARSGRSVVLGPEPLAPRTFAHEFGHVLGFSDAYLRAYEGDPDDPFGVVLVEWQGLFDDLMGDSSAGAVSADMVDELLAAYD